MPAKFSRRACTPTGGVLPNTRKSFRGGPPGSCGSACNPASLWPWKCRHTNIGRRPPGSLGRWARFYTKLLPRREVSAGHEKSRSEKILRPAATLNICPRKSRSSNGAERPTTRSSIAEIARRLSVAVDENRFSGDHGADPIGDDCGIGAASVLPRPKRVEVPQTDDREIELTCKNTTIIR